MLIGKHKDNFKVTIITLASALMLLVEPLLAEKARDNSGSSTRSLLPKGGSGSPRQAAPQVQPDRGKLEPRISLNTSGTASQSTFRRIIEPGISQPSSVASTQRSAGTTLSRAPILRIQSSFSAHGLSSSKISTGVSSPIGKQPIISRGNTLHIDRSINERPPPSAGRGTQSKPAVSMQKHMTPSSSPSEAGISSDKIQRSNTLIGQRRTSIDIIRKVTRGNELSVRNLAPQEPKAGAGTSLPLRKQEDSVLSTRLGTALREPKLGQKTTQMVRNHTSRIFGESKAVDKEPSEKGVETSRDSKRINLSVVDRLLPSSRPRTPQQLSGGARTIPSASLRACPELAEGTSLPEDGNKDKVAIGARPDNRATITNSNVISETGRVGETYRPSSLVPRPSGHDRRWRIDDGRDLPVRHIHHHEHVYWDRYNRLCHRIVWPGYRFVVYYGYGPYFTFRYVYPYHFRRYIFVSLGGYWPIGYRCIRYYWYGCHPYMWYGYYPIAREVKGDTYNYYTYNYYYDDNDIVASESSQVVDGIKPVDHNTFADVREKLAQQKAEEPELETPADKYFDEGVKAFEAGDYNIAIEKFAEAMELAPDDMVVPFAYSQALFASGQYCQAADVLRAALAKVCPEKEGVFYPRGLYLDDDILFEQIEHLTKKAEQFSFDADLQLLLGYQLLGIGEIDKAIEPLQRASQDFENAAAATTLLDLLAKIKADAETHGKVQNNEK